MSMGMVLQHVRDHLRSAMTLSVDQCDIHPGGKPPHAVGEFYLAIDDAGVQSSARSHLQEEYAVDVLVWRRLGQHPLDRQGDVLEKEDPYLPGLKTLDVLERDVIRHLHGNFTDITQAANETHQLGTTETGDIFQLALYYRGRKGTFTLPAAATPTCPAEWIGRRLHFTGMKRTQSIDIIR